MDIFGTLLTKSSSGGDTKRLTPETAKLLREADEVTRYNECGWACAMGWKGKGLGAKLVVAVHASSQEEIDVALGLRDPWEDFYGRFGIRR